MNIEILIQDCESFAKLAQQLNKQKQKVDPAKKAALIAAADTLFAGFRGTGTYLSSIPEAQKIFNEIANFHATPPAYRTPSAALSTVESLLTALKIGSEKLQALGLDPLEALRQRGVQNITPTSISILITNLEILRDAKDFSGYRQYNIGAPGAAHTYIDLDAPEVSKNDAGY